MDVSALAIQILNGVHYGLVLFLVASGLTLIFGIMGIINLAHGAFYMFGAYVAFWLTGLWGTLWAAIAIGVPLMALLGLAVERFAISLLAGKDHLSQVLLTYGLVLVLNESQLLLWGTDFHSVPVPAALSFSVPLTANQAYPAYRLFVSLVCLALAAVMALVIGRTRLGATIRAGAVDRELVQALGIDIGRILTIVFGVGAALAGFAGIVEAPLSSVYPGMGDGILIVSFVVVVIGGVGSIRGAFVGALLVGLADTLGRVLLPGFASVAIYVVMALVLLWRPHGLFGRPT